VKGDAATGRSWWILRGLGLVLILVATFPGTYTPLETGLDASYRYALNALAETGSVHGRDVVFTYGPLGYLLVPVDVGSNLLHAVAAWLLVHALLAVVLLHRIRSTGRFWPALAFGIPLLLALGLGMPFEYQLLLVVGMLVILSLEEGRGAAPAAASAGMLAAAGLLAKFSLGISALAIVLAGEMARAVQERPWRRWVAASAIAGYGATLFVLSLILFGSPSFFFRWISGSIELASGFSAAMSLPTRLGGLLMGQAAVLVFAVVVLLVRKAEGRLGHAGLVFLVPVLFSFKHGFVRQDLHIGNFFPFLIAAMGILLMQSRARREIAITSAGIAMVGMLAFGTYAQMGAVELPRIGWTLSGGRGLGNLSSLVTLPATRTALAAAGDVNLEKDRLPERWTAIMRASGVRADVYPWEIAYIAANDLDWAPNPLLQTYTAYTRNLDRMSAAHFSEETRPDFLLFEYKGIDMRHPLLDAPATWRSILRHYALLEGELAPPRLLLGAVESRFPPPGEIRLRAKGVSGEWVGVPESGRLLFAEIRMSLRLKGWLDKVLFRIPPVAMDVEYESGKTGSFRILPDTAVNGLLLNYLPSNVDETAGLLLGRAHDRVRRFRIGASGAFSYEPTFDVAWKEAAFPVEYTPSSLPEQQRDPS
jgi:hypothetical protein